MHIARHRTSSGTWPKVSNAHIECQSRTPCVFVNLWLIVRACPTGLSFDKRRIVTLLHRRSVCRVQHRSAPPREARRTQITGTASGTVGHPASYVHGPTGTLPRISCVQSERQPRFLVVSIGFLEPIHLACRQCLSFDGSATCPSAPHGEARRTPIAGTVGRQAAGHPCLVRPTGTTEIIFILSKTL